MKTKRSRGGATRQAGFTLIELMIALFIATIVAAGFYSLYQYQRKQYLGQQNSADLQANTRFIIESMGRDILLAGYKPAVAPGVTEASANRLVLEYTDDKGTDSAPYKNQRRVTFYIDTTKTNRPLMRKVEKYNPTSANADKYEAAVEYTIGEYVQSLGFTYYDSQNTAMAAPGTTLAQRNLVRSVQVAVNVRSYDKDPFVPDPTTHKPPYYKYLTLNSTYRVRNLGTASTPTDTTPPAPPAGLKVVDPGICGQLNVQWTANSEPDLAGYYLYVGLASGNYYDKIRIGSATATTYTITGLTSTRTTDVAVTYYVAMTAYDRSANVSSYSAEVSGNPSPSNSSFSGANDTTVNPAKPLPPATFDAQSASIEGAVDLTWTASPSANITGYRLHRSLTAGFTPTGSTAGTGTCIANESTLTKDVLTYQDTGLLGCTRYYYKIATVNCDPTLVASYLAADYQYAYGDGTGIGADSPTNGVTSTTPRDFTRPPAPVISSIPGWKRVFISLTNPVRALVPDFTFTRIYYNTMTFPTIDAQCQVHNGTLVPDHGGVFPNAGSIGNNFIHDSLTQESPMTPQLDNSTTYYYLAVTYDICGNCSEATVASTTLSTLCGDDPPGLPPGGLGMSLSAEGCGDYIELSWTEGTLKDVYDFAGYHVYRNEGTFYDPSDSTHVELTGGVPQWLNNFTDASVVAGKLYSYAVKYTDCAYENQGPTVGNISAAHTLAGVGIGRLAADPFGRVVTGAMSPGYKHNVVATHIQNSSGGTMLVTRLDVSWSNNSAYLEHIVIGDNSSTSQQTVWQDTARPLTNGYTGATIYLSKSIDALDAQVPVTFYFATVSGDVDSSVDMRQDILNIQMTYTNEKTGTDSCTVSTTTRVPQGPSIDRVTQAKPSVGSTAWPVPGIGAANPRNQLVVAGGAVSVSALVEDTDSAGITSVVLYYYVDNTNLLATPPVYNGANYTSLPMTKIAGTLWQATPGIPASDNASIWYFLVALDANGNFDRAPDIDFGAFQYYEQAASTCSNTPKPPGLTGTLAGTGLSVTLSWTAPTQNTDNSACGDLAGYKIYRNDGTSWSLRQLITGTGTLTYTDAPADITTKNYAWYVTAYDSCSPTANESAPSAIYAECSGAPLCGTLNVTATGTPPYQPGMQLTISLTICGKALNGTSNEIVWVQTCGQSSSCASPRNMPDVDPVRMVEQSDTGIFSVDSSAYGGRSSINTYLCDTYPASANALDLWVANGDTVTVKGYNDSGNPPNDSVCNISFDCAVNSFPSFVIPANPCITPQTAPGVPRTLSTGSVNCSSAKTATLSWVAPLPVAGATITGYQVFECTYTTTACNPLAGTNDTVPPLAATTLSYGISAGGGKFNAIKKVFAVRAVNATCAASPVYGPAATINDPCAPF